MIACFVPIYCDSVFDNSIDPGYEADVEDNCETETNNTGNEDSEDSDESEASNSTEIEFTEYESDITEYESDSNEHESGD